MAAENMSKKRKSADGVTTSTKKIKMAKSADKPAPPKSALKKAKTTIVQDPAADEDPVVETEQTTLEDEEGNGNTDLTPDQTAALLAGFSSSDSEAGSEDEAGVSISSIPKAPTKGLIKKRIKQAVEEQNDPETTPGVIYIGRTPHGFYEKQMRAYFSQFGDILHLKLARNKKTGASQHFAFIEFASAAVADIVAKTMDKYLLFGHILQVRRVPGEQIGERMWMGRRKKKVAPRNRLEGGLLGRGATREVWEKRVEKEVERRKEKAEKLREMGYVLEMPGVKGVGEVPVKPKEVEGAVDGGEGDGGVKVWENGEAAETGAERGAEPDVPVESTMEVEPNAAEATEKVTKKRTAHGKTQEKKTVKKVEKIDDR